jgi:prevent-host-death family protein
MDVMAKSTATNRWKLQDAKARFSEVVRQARAGHPQEVTVHGEPAVVIVDPKRFDVSPKPARERTMAEFVERSRKYRGILEGTEFDRKTGMVFRDRSSFSSDENSS